MVRRVLHIILFTYLFTSQLLAVNEINYTVNQEFMDSLEVRIVSLRNELPNLKKSRDPKYLNTKQQLDKSIFVKAFESFVLREELFQAKELVELRIMRVKQTRDDGGLAFYSLYVLRSDKLIKEQKIRYQKLFAKERNFKKAFNKLIDVETIDAYFKAKQMTLLAIKYAQEQQMTATVGYLNTYHNYVNALIFDEESVFDLYRLTRNEKDFFAEFNPLVKSDSLDLIKRADTLVQRAYSYAANSKSILDTNFFAKQRRVIITATSDYYTRLGNNLEEIANQIVDGRLNKPNEIGVFKWGEYILVVDTFTLTASFENVNRGMAILQADKKLLEYIRVNELAKIKKGLKIGHAFVLPYVINGSKKDFYYSPYQNSWQYMVCYTTIENKVFTRNISQYMKPINFSKALSESDLAQNSQ